METLFKVVRHGVLAASLVMWVPGVSEAYTARLTWSPSSGATGYRVYVRQNGDAYGAPIDLGMRLPDADGLVRYDLGGLDAAQNEWFAVSSYAASGESERSNEMGVAAGSMPAPTATQTAVPTATRTATPIPTATQTAVPTATRTATPVPTATQTAAPTATRTATPIPTATQTAVPTATRTATPVPTATQTAVPTATRTATPVPTTTQTPVPTATQTAVPTATRTATPVPTETQTPVPTATQTLVPTATETAMPTATPTVVPTATAVPTPVPTVVVEVFHFPLAGWRTGRNKGTWELAFDAEVARDALLTSSDQGDKLTVLYPTRGELSVALPVATLFAKFGPTGGLGLAVRGTDGRSYWLRYRVGAGVASVWRQSAWFPLGASVGAGAWGTTTRDLAADLRAAFGVGFAAVEQAELSGTMGLADLVLGPSTVTKGEVASEMALPLDASTVRSRGAAVRWQYDAGMDCPAMGTPPDCDTRAVVDVPASPRRLAAPYGSLSFVLADGREFAVEVRVVTTVGTQTLRYDDATVTPVVRDRRARLPLARRPVDGADLDLVTIDMAGDVAAAYPGVALLNVERVRVSGRFRIGDATLENPLAGD